MSRIDTKISSLTALNQVSTLRARLGAFQTDLIQATSNSLSVALENISASESNIRDVDLAAETAGLTRSPILVQANAAPPPVLKPPQ